MAEKKLTDCALDSGADSIMERIRILEAKAQALMDGDKVADAVKVLTLVKGMHSEVRQRVKEDSGPSVEPEDDLVMDRSDLVERMRRGHDWGSGPRAGKSYERD